MKLNKIWYTLCGYECVTQEQYDDIIKLHEDERFMACSGDYDDDKDTRERYRIYEMVVVKPLKDKYKGYEKYWSRNYLGNINKVLKVVQ